MSEVPLLPHHTELRLTIAILIYVKSINLCINIKTKTIESQENS